MPAYDASTRMFDVNEGINKKKCRMCQVFKAEGDFYYHPFNSDRLSSLCKLCLKEEMKRRYHRNPSPTIERTAKRRVEAKHDIVFKLKKMLTHKQDLLNKHNVPCNLTFEYLYDLYDAQKGKCALTGREMTIGESDNNQAGHDALSLDRVEPNKGYVVGNVRFVINQVNMAKHRFDDVQLLDLCTAVVKHFHTDPDNWGAIKSIEHRGPLPYMERKTNRVNGKIDTAMVEDFL